MAVSRAPINWYDQTLFSQMLYYVLPVFVACQFSSSDFQRPASPGEFFMPLFGLAFGIVILGLLCRYCMFIAVKKSEGQPVVMAGHPYPTSNEAISSGDAPPPYMASSNYMNNSQDHCTVTMPDTAYSAPSFSPTDCGGGGCGGGGDTSSP
jgi:hypothetical protein